jgi:Predicted transcriptional regulators
MEYTIQELASLAGISTRTLRYYDQMGLLSPSFVNASGYRMYTSDKVDQLQQILLYRAMDVPLKDIASILFDPAFDRDKALNAHLSALQTRRKQLDELITTVEKSIQSSQGGHLMTDKEKFEGLKKQLVEENEQKYGEELRNRYDQSGIDHANRAMLNMSEETYGEMQALSKKIADHLVHAIKTGADPEGDAGKALYLMHKKWLHYTWRKYSPQAHKGLAQMYIDDERFSAHYDAEQPGCTQFLCDAIQAHAR